MPKPATASLPQFAAIVSRWLLNEASGNRADSVGSNTLTDVNTVAAGAGLNSEYANSADFESGNSEALTIADNASLSITGALTISFWYKPESQLAAQDLVTKWQNNAGHNSWRLTTGFVANGLTWTVSGTGSNEITVNSGTGIFSNGTWYHVVCVFRPSTEIEVYVNATSRGNNTTSIPATIFDSDAQFRVSNINNGAYTNWIDGLVQDVIVWGAALTDAEVATLYKLYTSSIKSVNGLGQGSIKSMNGLATASVKSRNGLA